MCIVVQGFLLTLSLPVYQNAHVNIVFARRFIAFDVYFIFTVPLLTFINTKENMCSEEFLMLLMDRNYNPFAILNKQGHIINGTLPVALRCVTFFSHMHTSEPTSVLFSYKSF